MRKHVTVVPVLPCARFTDVVHPSRAGRHPAERIDEGTDYSVLKDARRSKLESNDSRLRARKVHSGYSRRIPAPPISSMWMMRSPSAASFQRGAAHMVKQPANERARLRFAVPTRSWSGARTIDKWEEAATSATQVSAAVRTHPVRPWPT